MRIRPTQVIRVISFKFIKAAISPNARMGKTCIGKNPVWFCLKKATEQNYIFNVLKAPDLIQIRQFSKKLSEHGKGFK